MWKNHVLDLSFFNEFGRCQHVIFHVLALIDHKIFRCCNVPARGFVCRAELVMGMAPQGRGREQSK